MSARQALTLSDPRAQDLQVARPTSVSSPEFTHHRKKDTEKGARSEKVPTTLW